MIINLTPTNGETIMSDDPLPEAETARAIFLVGFK
jgi:hypothetical protein